MKKAQTESHLSITSKDINIELGKEFLKELQVNAYHGWIDEDVINHIAMVLKMIDSIYISGMDSHQLRMKIFPFSLADEAKQWRINEGDGKITIWEELIEKFFCKFYPESYDGEDEMLDEGGNWGIDPLKFISRNKIQIDEGILRSNNTTTDSFFKPYLITHGKSDTKKEDERSQTKRKYSNTSNYIDELPNKRRCKAEKFEAIQYSLGPNEEYIAIRMSALKLPVLKTRDYDLWSMRMKQYLTHTDYALWEVIVNGDAHANALASAGTEGPIPPKIVEQKLLRKNELKEKSTLLLAIPDEYLLKFHGIKDAKTLWEAIKTSFGGNKESKKIQKTILKQQYENFVASRSEGLDKTYDRFQKLISQLEIHGEDISQEDANLKLLRSLPLVWNNIALIMRNKSDLDTLSMDDLYNNLKVYKAEIKGQSSSSLNSQNVAFVSSKNTSSTNEVVNTAHDVSTASLQGQVSSLTYADDVMFSFFAN
ncbi:hypothetical protein Tco_1499236 [Tanacetum coccineum]